MTKIKIECIECEGLGRIPVCPEPRYDEWEDCPVCEGHGHWLEEEEVVEKMRGSCIVDEEIDTMFNDYEVERLTERKNNGYYD